MNVYNALLAFVLYEIFLLYFLLKYYARVVVYTPHTHIHARTPHAHIHTYTFIFTENGSPNDAKQSAVVCFFSAFKTKINDVSGSGLPIEMCSVVSQPSDCSYFAFKLAHHIRIQAVFDHNIVMDRHTFLPFQIPSRILVRLRLQHEQISIKIFSKKYTATNSNTSKSSHIIFKY